MNLFELFVKIGVDDQASGKLKDLGSKLGNGLKTAAKIGTTAVGAAAYGITALTTAAVNNYAEYEQLVGGVDTLFKDASQKVQQYAADAYKTAGMSANDYMANATAFSASLISALGDDTEAAAEYANRAMVSMSDNANKMGTNIDSIVQTYQSLARGNFAMLDNLKLGYGGTKAELERLIADAASYTEIQKKMGITVDASSTSFDNIVNAIAVVQGKLGIAGATALEAGTTIEGSVNSMKAAWDNLITGVADDNADFEGLINNFVDSLVVAGENIIPRINTVIKGLTQLITQASQTIIPLAVDTLLQNLPSIVAAGMDMVLAIVNGILDNIDLLIDCTLDIIDVIVDKLIENLPKLVEGGIRLIVALAGGLIEAIPQLVENIPEIIMAIVEGFAAGASQIFEVGKNIVRGVWEGIKSMGDWLWNSVKGFFSGIVDGVKSLLGIQSPSKVFSGIGKFMAEGLGDGWDSQFGKVKSDIENGLDFDAANIGLNVKTFSQPTFSQMQPAVAMSGYGGYANQPQPITIPITLELDGSVLARKTYSYNQTEIARHGKSFVR